MQKQANLRSKEKAGWKRPKGICCWLCRDIGDAHCKEQLAGIKSRKQSFRCHAHASISTLHLSPLHETSTQPRFSKQNRAFKSNQMLWCRIANSNLSTMTIIFKRFSLTVNSALVCIRIVSTELLERIVSICRFCAVLGVRGSCAQLFDGVPCRGAALVTLKKIVVEGAPGVSTRHPDVKVKTQLEQREKMGREEKERKIREKGPNGPKRRRVGEKRSKQAQHTHA